MVDARVFRRDDGNQRLVLIIMRIEIFTRKNIKIVKWTAEGLMFISMALLWTTDISGFGMLMLGWLLVVVTADLMQMFNVF